jgi:hypothetical protein
MSAKMKNELKLKSKKLKLLNYKPVRTTINTNKKKKITKTLNEQLNTKRTNRHINQIKKNEHRTIFQKHIKQLIIHTEYNDKKLNTN